MALLIIYGCTRIILGGDVESAGWLDVMREFGSENLSSHAVKISHHGSTNGYADELWPFLARERLPVTVLTSYRSKGLPRNEAVAHIRQFSSRILTPCLPAIYASEQTLPLSTKAPIESRKAIREKLKATAVGGFQVGRCGFIFDDVGNCIDESFEGHAGEIPM